ncbi:MAG: LysE family transporter [Pseudomonadota bacterium]
MDSSLAIFGTVALAHALAVASPGPDFAMVSRQSLSHGRSAGLWTAAGIGSGILFHVAYGLFGLAWILERYPQFLSWIAYAGAGFLLYMGYGALRSQPHPESGDTLPAAQAGDWKKNYTIGLLTNVLNPKATLFFVALFTAVITGPMPMSLKVILGLWLPLTTFGWFALVALLLSKEKLRQRLRRSAHLIDRAMGAILIALGVGMLLSRLS